MNGILVSFVYFMCMIFVSVLIIRDTLNADKMWKRALMIMLAPLTIIIVVLVVIVSIFALAIFKEE